MRDVSGDLVLKKNTAGQARCLTYVAPGKAEIREVDATLPGASGDTAVAARALWTSISRGTERLVFNGQVPESEHERMRAPFQHGSFPFPIGYGYAWVGIAEAGDLAGKTCFGLFPHQDRVVAPAEALIALPEGLDPRRAVLGANMETALNITWDSGAGPADRVAVVGGGVVGLLTASILAGIPGTEVTVVDIEAKRAPVARAMGVGFALPEDGSRDCDVVIHASASEAGLQTALGLAGMEATVVEASWYGTKTPAVPLGGAFHSMRLTLRSSQVGMIPPSRRPRWSHRRRMEAALRLLADPRYDALITDEIPFETLPEIIGDILAPGADGLAVAVSYL